MKNRVKGLLALCLAMCMVLAMTTVAFADGTTYYYNDSTTLTNWTSVIPGDEIKAYSGCSFYVVDGNGNYLATAHTEDANGTAYSSSKRADAQPGVTSTDRKYFKSESDTFTVRAVSVLFGSGYAKGYHYEAKKVAVTDESTSTEKIYDNCSGLPLIPNALQIKLVENSNFTVNYNLDGGKIGDKTSIASVSNVAWTYKVLTNIGTPEKDGFTFKGWKCTEFPEAEVGSNTTYGGITNSDLDLSITLVAQWQQNEVTPPDETPTTPTPTHQHTRRQPAATTVETPTTVASPKTFDAGVAVYGVMAALSLTGTAAIIGKKRKF